MPSGEVYPLVLSFAITIQSTTFAVAQSAGLQNIVIYGCTLISQLMLPGMTEDTVARKHISGC